MIGRHSGIFVDVFQNEPLQIIGSGSFKFLFCDESFFFCGEGMEVYQLPGPFSGSEAGHVFIMLLDSLLRIFGKSFIINSVAFAVNDINEKLFHGFSGFKKQKAQII
jgi:hypothetical protein